MSGHGSDFIERNEGLKMLVKDDGYNYFKNRLFKRKTKPFLMSNEPLAKEYFERFKEEYPGASMHVYDFHQYICLDDRARRNLLKQMKQQKKEQEKALFDTVQLISEIETTCKGKEK